MTTSIDVFQFKKEIIQMLSPPELPKAEAEEKIQGLFIQFLQSIEGLDNQGELQSEAGEYKDSVLSKLDDIFEKKERASEQGYKKV
ncbi:hypothetical protein [Candidatus Neptunichlamydia sp. REUL1]|uniref:hypothetical protein n=1 Tax=Candidatus Neptunichlamydia sp. REUL1 TaxID=3064277 RepID=UPI00292D6D1C|nr:hypothetical protein [Candidatus Neptunochlamydia sp. REUL1]